MSYGVKSPKNDEENGVAARKLNWNPAMLVYRITIKQKCLSELHIFNSRFVEEQMRNNLLPEQSLTQTQVWIMFFENFETVFNQDLFQASAFWRFQL